MESGGAGAGLHYRRLHHLCRPLLLLEKVRSGVKCLESVVIDGC